LLFFFGRKVCSLGMCMYNWIDFFYDSRSFTYKICLTSFTLISLDSLDFILCFSNTVLRRLYFVDYQKEYEKLYILYTLLCELADCSGIRNFFYFFFCYFLLFFFKKKEEVKKKSFFFSYFYIFCFVDQFLLLIDRATISRSFIHQHRLRGLKLVLDASLNWTTKNYYFFGA